MTNLALKLCGEGYQRPYARYAAGSSRPAWLSDICAIIDRAKNGHISILVDNEQSDSGAILFVPAQMATSDAINFMARHGRGVICLALTADRVEALGLERMPRADLAYSGAPFTVSIEARTGVTTGISAFDRARTIAVAISAVETGDELVSPGHVFPLVAAAGGTLSHPGQAEAAVDLSRLAGLNPSGVFCALLNELGDVARAADFAPFAEMHGLAIGSISDLVGFRLEHDWDVVRAETTIRTGAARGRFHVHMPAISKDRQP